MLLARMLGALGRTMIASGVLILLFVAYQLWGTGIATSRAQSRLEDEFAHALERVDDGAPAATSSTTTTTEAGGSTTTATLPPMTVPALDVLPEPGKAAGRIVIPAIGVDWIFVEGVSVGDLKKGPGHYPGTPLPGQAGNAAIAGHRTTYGAPFGDVDQLQPGDEIVVTTVQGEFSYRVTEQFVVKPGQIEVLDDKGDNRLTLTSCHPKYTARERIVVVAELGGQPVPAPPQDGPEPGLTELEGGLSGQSVARWPTIVWAVACAAIWLGAWLLARAWRRWASYALGLPVFLVALFFFFENFSRLLPSNY